MKHDFKVGDLVDIVLVNAYPRKVATGRTTRVSEARKVAYEIEQYMTDFTPETMKLVSLCREYYILIEYSDIKKLIKLPKGVENDKVSKKENTNKKGKNMSNIKESLKAQGTLQLDLAKGAAGRRVGDFVNTRASKLFAKHLPMGFGGMAKSPFFKLVVAHAAALAIKSTFNSDKAEFVATAMLDAATDETSRLVDLNEMFESLTEGIDFTQFESQPATAKELTEDEALKEINGGK